MIKRICNFIYNDMFLPVLCLLFFILSFCFEKPMDVFVGYYNILISKSILLTDYIYIAGMGATFLNASIILGINLLLLKLLKIQMNGPIFAGFIMILGFSFFGKNLVNTLPIYLGIYIYSLIKKTKFKNYMIAILFSTGISPVVSFTIFSFEWYIGIPLGIIVGVFVGILIPTISSHTVLFHKGYNLYNTGFALGVISVLCYALFKGFGIEVNSVLLIDNKHELSLLIILLCISLFSILVAFIRDSKVLLKYKNLLTKSGRLITDFIRDDGKDVVLFNFGLLGLVSLIFVFIFDISLNGATFGSIVAIMGFASYGLHIKNALPIWLGAIVGIFVRGDSFESISVVMAFFFCTGLAPIAGKYGIIYGMIAGFLHINLTPLMLSFQGGFDLYNNGFSAGFVAMLVVNLKEAISRREEY